MEVERLFIGCLVAAVEPGGGFSLADERGRVAAGRLLIGYWEAVGFFEVTPEVNDSWSRA